MTAGPGEFAATMHLVLKDELLDAQLLRTVGTPSG
jgi:hypothetical protein